MDSVALNRAADALRDWLYENYDMDPVDAVRLLALVIGGYATTLSSAPAEAVGERNEF